MNHHSVSDINTDMAGPRRVIGATEKDQITGLCFTCPDGLAVVLQAIRRKPSHIPAVAAVIDDPTHKPGTVEAGRR